MILTEIGELGIDYKGREYIFRPSFFNMTNIGSPQEIVRCFAAVNGGTFNDLMNKLAKAEVLNQFTAKQLKNKNILGEILRSAILIMSCCCEDDITDLVGGYKPGKKGLVYQPGKMEQDKIIIIARHLVKHGVVGEGKSTGKGEYSSEFNAREFVNLAIAHLGVSESDAWQMTMTSFRGIMQAKFPSEDDHPTSDEYDQVMALGKKKE